MKQTKKQIKNTITIGWIYPQLMSTYGDRGNIITLTKRCEWRDIGVLVKELNIGFKTADLLSCDLLFMGGAQDKQQSIVAKDFTTEKIDAITKLIMTDTPGLYICGAYQFLGKYYQEADGTIITCLGIFDLYTKSPNENNKRLIGNMAFTPTISDAPDMKPIIGFENHGGRTYLGKSIKPFGTVLVGNGNNGEDTTEGAQYKKSFGTYCHGPILPKNPEFADYLIKSALNKKYGEEIILKKLDDTLEIDAQSAIANRLHITI